MAARGKLSTMPRIPTGSVYQPKYRDRAGVRRTSKTWWVKYYRPGQAKPVRESAGTEARAEAVDFLRRRMASLTAADAGAEKVTVGQLLDLLVEDYKRRGRKSTYDLECKVEAQLRPWFGSRPAARLSTLDIKAFISKRQTDGMAPASINRELSALRRALALGAQEDPPLVVRIPHVAKLPEAEPREGLLDHATYLRVRDLLPAYARLALVLSYHTGARRGELLSIRRQDVDLVAGRIQLRGRKTKNGRPRYLPIYGDMAAELGAAIDAGAKGCPLLIQDAGQPVASFRKSWAKACALAGVPGQLFHDLRRTALTNMIDAGLSEKDAMEISGHRTRAVFERYHIVTDKRLKLNAEKMEAHLAKRDADVRRLMAADGSKPQ